MKIILEPTTGNWKEGGPETRQHRVELVHPDDDISLEHVVSLMAFALQAWGFACDPQEVRETLEERTLEGAPLDAELPD